MRTIMLILLSVLMIPTVAPLHAETADGGSNTAQILRQGVGSAGPAMGDAQTGAAIGATALHFNPAGLVHTNKNTGLMGFQSLVEDMKQGDMYLSTPLSDQSSVNDFWSDGGYDATMGYGLKYVDYGQTDQTTLSGSSFGLEAQDRGTFTGSDIVGTIGVAGRLPGNFAWGVAGKGFRLEIADVTATGYAVDAGLQHWVPAWGFSHGMILKNAGPDITFMEADESLPTVARYGIGLKPMDSVMVTADVEREMNRESFGYMTGVAWRFAESMTVRAGYDDRVDLDNGVTGGFTFHPGDYEVGYSYQPFGDFGNQHKFTLAFDWGQSSASGFEQRETESQTKQQKKPETHEIKDETPDTKTVRNNEPDTDTVQNEEPSEDTQRSVPTTGTTVVSEGFCVQNYDGYSVAKTESQSRETTHTVRRGDNIWKLSGCHLKVAWTTAQEDLSVEKGLPPEELPNELIARYWETVKDENVDNLRSGNPNIIYPGEELIFPKVQDQLITKLLNLNTSDSEA